MKDILLTPFAPLIQFWAGICLLFLYEPLLKNFPLTEHQKEKNELFDDFLGKNQAFLTNDQLKRGYESRENKWDLFREAIQKLSILLFSYSLFLLAYIGIEEIDNYSEHYQALQFINIATICYIICTWLFHRIKLFRKIGNPLFFFGLLVIFFHFHQSINLLLVKQIGIWGEYFNRSEMTILTLFTCFLPAFITALQIGFDYVTIWYKKKRIKELKERFEQWTMFLLNESIEKEKNIIGDKNEIEESIKQRSQTEYDIFLNYWYQNLFIRITQLMNFKNNFRKIKERVYSNPLSPNKNSQKQE